MSLIYLQSMYSESCFSERSRNKQQALLLLTVSEPTSGAEHVCRGVAQLGCIPLKDSFSSNGSLGQTDRQTHETPS